jgi:hypothetical protein
MLVISPIASCKNSANRLSSVLKFVKINLSFFVLESAASAQDRELPLN